MTDTDTFIRSGFDRRYSALTGEPKWDDVLARVDELSLRRRRRMTPVLALVAAVLVAGAVSLVVVAPWSGSPGLVQQALAALGNGRYIHAVLEPTAVVRQLDLASGKERTLPPSYRIEMTYDAKTGTNHAVVVIGGRAYGGAGGAHRDPAISLFASGYRTALKEGKAHVVRATTIGGVAAVVVRFEVSGGFEYVTIPIATSTPLRVTYVQSDPRAVPRVRSFRVVAIGSSDSPPKMPVAHASSRVDSSATNPKPVTVATASTALGRSAVWPGAAVGGASLRSIMLEQLTTSFPPIYRTGEGLRFDYRGAGESLTIQEAASAHAIYGFPFVGIGMTLQPLPPEGQALVARGIGCGDFKPNKTNNTRLWWQAQLRTHGLYVNICSPSRSLAVETARALRPMP
jgi:hypothetical protein